LNLITFTILPEQIKEPIIYNYCPGKKETNNMKLTINQTTID
jgi:hypothetical protein